MSVSQPPNPFLFPKAESEELPDPSEFFSPHLLSSPLPTHSFFQNFVLNEGDEGEYIHPYLVKSCNSQLSICYPRRLATCDFTCLSPNEESRGLTISARQENTTTKNLTHKVSSFSDLSVTLDFPSTNLSFFLVRGSPYLTCELTSDVQLIISNSRGLLLSSADSSLTKHTIKLHNEQTWLLYSSLPIKLRSSRSDVYSDRFSGVIRIALLTNSNPLCEAILDRFSSCYPVSGGADITEPFCVEYKWETVGRGGLLMLAHPLHPRLLSTTDCTITVLEDFKYESIDGELVGVVGDSWVLKTSDDLLSVNWHSLKGIDEDSRPEIRNALKNDVEAMVGEEILTKDFYSYARLIARAARFAMIAEEVSYYSVIPHIANFLKDQIAPWLDGNYQDIGFLYDGKWGGVVMKTESEDSLLNEFGLYHDHHFHVSYFLYAIAVLAKIEPAWGIKYKPQAYSLILDFMNSGRDNTSFYPRLRCFDFWRLHSWTGGLNTKNRILRETGEVLNAYYSAVLMGLAYEDTDLVYLGSTLSAMEIHSTKTWLHVRKEDNMYAQEFSKNTSMVGSLSSDGLRRGAYPLEFNNLPIIPITEVLFSDTAYVRKLVKWSMSVGLASDEFVYALEAIYNNKVALRKIRRLTFFNDGNSFTNLLWWVHSRGSIIMPSPFSSPTSSGQGRPIMAWADRIKVAIGTACGITYLHQDCSAMIIHRDIKSSNILLDYNLDAKVADFGLAKLVPETKTHVSTIHLAGTPGYIAPEYVSSCRLTKKSDVYSFGVVLLELVTGHMPLIISQSFGQQSLVEWARPFLTQQPPNEEDFQKLVDRRLEKNFVRSEMFRMIKVAAACVRHSYSERPQMSQVVIDLKGLVSSDQT